LIDAARRPATLRATFLSLTHLFSRQTHESGQFLAIVGTVEAVDCIREIVPKMVPATRV